MESFLYHHHTRDELLKLAEEDYAVVIPIAATEQHGPHLSVYTDSQVMGHVSYNAVKKSVEEQGSRLLLAPLLPIGCSEHHLSFGGTLTFSSTTYLHMLKDIGESLIRGGFKKIIYLNGHGGNEYMMQQTVQDLAVKHPIWVAASSYWNLSREALEEINASEVGPVPGHAGGFETAAMMALDASLVRPDKILTEHPSRPWIGTGPRGAFIGKHGELTGADGYTDAANLATAEKGTKYLSVIVDSVSEWLTNVERQMNAGSEE